MNKITSYSADYQTFPTRFELEPVAGKKVTVDFSAPELSSLGGLSLVREYEKSSNRIIERIESCIKDPRREPMVVHSQTEMFRQRICQIMAGFENADTYGAQQLTLFNAYYGEYCYMPLQLFEGRSGKLILPILRPGQGNKAINISDLLKQLITKLHKKWKHTQIIVRGDSHFCSHDFMDWATEQQDGIHFITGLAGNVKLQKITAHWLDTAVASYKTTGEEVRMFHSFTYKADSWKHPQMVVVKIEVNSLGTNVRYVVTDFKGQRSSFIHSEYY